MKRIEYLTAFVLWLALAIFIVGLWMDGTI